MLAAAMAVGMMSFAAFAEEDACTHSALGSWVASEDGTACVKKCKTCGEVVESHDTAWSEWKAPLTDGNTYSNACRRNCTADGCTRNEHHNIQGEWKAGDENYTLTCTTCGAVQICDHSCGWGPWRINGDNCVRKCRTCSLEDSHLSQWGEYVGPDKALKHYSSGRYCTVEGCNQVNRIDTVEELQAAIKAGLTTIQPDSWEPFFYDPKVIEIHNCPITITEDVTIDGGETGVTIQRLGYGYGAGKKPTFIVENGATLTLKNLTILGGGGDMNGSSMILVNDGTVILDDGAELANGGSYGPCSGIHLKGGNLEMREGSRITGIVSDSSIYIEKGTFTMNGGEISGNTDAGVGSQGVILVSGSEPADAKFIMNGGSISENGSSEGYGMGTVAIQCGDAIINDGKITNNVGMITSGVFMGKGSLTITGGEISGNTSVMGAGIVSESALVPVLGGGAEGIASVTISGGVMKGNVSNAEGDLAGLFPTGDAILAFTDCNIDGGEIGTLCGNNEMLKFMTGEDIDNLTEEELLQLGQQQGLTAEQLAMKPAITGGVFQTDVSKYVPGNIAVTPNEDGSFTVGGTAEPAAISASDVDAVLTADGTTATIRFITKVDAAAEQPTAFYTWILPQFVFDKVTEDIPYAVVNYTDTVEAGKTFAADLENIPYEYFDEPIMAWSHMETGAEKASCDFAAGSVNGIVDSKQN